MMAPRARWESAAMLRAVCLVALALALALVAVPPARARPDAPARPLTVSTFRDNTITNGAATKSGAAETQPPPPVHQRFPHAVLFGRTCGGSIIHERWVLTAAHCTLFTGGHSVLAGTSVSDDGSGTTVRVKKLYIHPLFSVGPYWVNARRFGLKQVAARWDFMLAELEQPLALDGVNMAAVPLDREPDVPELLPVGYGGYGADHHGGTMRHQMHAMQLQRVSDERCGSLEQYNKLDMVCAEGRTPSRDSACNGDSGSGLVTEDGNRRLVGVASWVQDDAHECSPGKLVVFSRVAAARAWIAGVTGGAIPNDQ